MRRRKQQRGSPRVFVFLWEMAPTVRMVVLALGWTEEEVLAAANRVRAMGTDLKRIPERPPLGVMELLGPQGN